MSKDYTFVTINTLVNIGDGNSSFIDENGNITPTANLARIVDAVLHFSYPFVTRVEHREIDLSKPKNKSYYKLHSDATCAVYTFKFTVSSLDVEGLRKRLDGVPLVVPTIIDDHIIRKFTTLGNKRNTSILCNNFA